MARANCSLLSIFVMRIGIDGLPLLTPLTGVGHYTLELARALASIAPTDEFELISPRPPSLAAAEKLNHATPANLRWVQSKRWRLNRYWWGAGLPLHLRRSSLDLFHGTNFEIPFWDKRPAVLTIHDLSSLLHPEKHEKRLARRARWRLPLMVKSAAMIITPTESVKRELCEHLGVDSGKVAVTPEAPRSVFKRVESEQAIETRKRLGIRDNFILFVGTIEPRKNLLTLARAFDQILRQTSLRPQLVIAGKEGWLMNDLFRFINRAGIQDDVCFTGYLGDDDLRALYSSCTLFVYPSLYEGFGLPPLEAMACGAPVITSRIPPIMETVETAAYLVDPANAQELASAIVRLLEDPGAREQLSILGAQQVRNFTWERTASLTLEVYKEVLGLTG
jgi:glycosyltransferase involved in cell wall biosynthesis